LLIHFFLFLNFVSFMG